MHTFHIQVRRCCCHSQEREQESMGSAASCPLLSPPSGHNRFPGALRGWITQEGRTDTDCCFLQVLCSLIQIAHGELQQNKRSETVFPSFPFIKISRSPDSCFPPLLFPIVPTHKGTYLRLRHQSCDSPTLAYLFNSVSLGKKKFRRGFFK